MDRISPNFKYALILTTSFMALDLRQNFASAQYLENKLTEVHQILNMHSY